MPQNFDFLKTPLQLAALDVANKAHDGQVRKYSGIPYITHPLAVARLVYDDAGSDEEVAAALLHDVIDDTADGPAPVRYEDILSQFGYMVAGIVSYLSIPPWVNKDMKRAEKKRLENEWLAQSGPPVHRIKLADMLHNGPEIRDRDPAFAKVWFAEAYARLGVLRFGSLSLTERVWDMVIDYRKQTNR